MASISFEAVVTDPKEIEAIKFYLASAAITLAGFNDYPQSQTSKIREAEAGVTLFGNLTDNKVKTEHEAWIKTRDTIFSRRENQISFEPTEAITNPAGLEIEENLPKKLAEIKSKLKHQFDEWKEVGFVPEMRDILSLNRDIKTKHPAESEYLFDLAIGDINLRSDTIEPE